MSSVKDGAPRRRYASPVREENARRTRKAIVAAASELFTARGYAATSLADVAAAAGVARPTVFAAFGSKPALLRQVLDQALAGDDEPVPVASRPWFRPVWDAPTQDAVLGAYAQVCTLIGGRAAQSFEAAGMSHEEAHAKARENADDIKTRAEKRSRSALIVDAIADQENIEVTDDDVAERIGQMVTYAGRAREQMAEHYRSEENRAALKQVMRREKTLDMLLNRAQGEAAVPASTETSSEVPPSSSEPPASEEPPAGT